MTLTNITRRSALLGMTTIPIAAAGPAASAADPRMDRLAAYLSSLIQDRNITYGVYQDRVRIIGDITEMFPYCRVPGLEEAARDVNRLGTIV